MDVVRLIDKAGVDSFIRNQVFDNIYVFGPAVLAPLTDVTIQDCSWDADPEAVFIEVPEGKPVIGVIGLVNTIFRNCRFSNVALIGTKETIDNLRRGFIAEPPPLRVPRSTPGPADPAPAPAQTAIPESQNR